MSFLVGATNTGKSTLVEGFDDLYGFEKVFHLPAVTDGKYGLRNWMKDKRSVFWDEFHPVEFAHAGVLAVTTFKKAFGGKWFEIQRSQSFHDGNADFRWQQGVVFTNKEQGLWDTTELVSAEDVSHLQSRVELFRFTHVVVPPGDRPSKGNVPTCAVHQSRWIRDGAADFDSMQGLRMAPSPARADAADGCSDGDSVVDLAKLFEASRLPQAVRAAFTKDILSLGALDVVELTRQDWEQLPAWQQL